MLKKLRHLCAFLRATPPTVSNRRRFVPRLECLEDRMVPATFTVTTPLDVVASADGKLSLREAISQANAHTGPDTILLPAGVFRLTRGGADDTNAAGDLDVQGSTLFQGAGAGNTIIDGHALDRVFDVLGTAPRSINVTFEGLTVRNGVADDGGGGGIRVGNADLVVQDCAVTGNRTTGFGGGISNAALPETGNVSLVNSTIARNVGGAGGSVAVLAAPVNPASVLTVSGSTIRHNRANGGGLSVTTATLSNSTVSGNSAALVGGGIEADTVTLTNCTVSGNTANNNVGGGAGNAARRNDRLGRHDGCRRGRVPKEVYEEILSNVSRN